MRWAALLVFLFLAIPTFAQDPFTVQVRKTYSIDIAGGCSPGYYFNSNGLTIGVEIDEGEGYPQKSYKYVIGNFFPPLQNGQLMLVSINVAGDESYQFLPDGSLVGHWIGNKCYNTNGSSCGVRKIFTTKN